MAVSHYYGWRENLNNIVGIMYLGEDLNGFLLRYGGDDGPMKLAVVGDHVPAASIPLAVANPNEWIGVDAN